MGQKIIVEAQVPCVVIVEGEGCLKLSKKIVYSDIKWIDTGTKSVCLTAPPLQKTKFTLRYFEGVTSHVPFLATIQYTMDNGSIFSAEIRGLYSGVRNSGFVFDSKAVANWNINTKSWEQI